MWRTLTALTLLSTLAHAAPGSGAAGAMVPAVETVSEEQTALNDALAEACTYFRGENSLASIRSLLEQGADANNRSVGNETPLLLLCHDLEFDYRYRQEPAFRQAVEEAITLLLRQGADPLLENNLGCNAIFYIEGKPEFARKLAQEELLPRELALRIPTGGAALTRYVRKRATQAALTRHEGSLAYLSRRYCAPAYERVFERLQRYLRAESSAHLPPSAMQDCLAFLRIADREKMEQWVNESSLWEHSEHFLEEIPEHYLSALCQLGWKVDSANLLSALRKLDSMLPRAKDDMIECFAGIPMAQLLRMLHSADAAAAEPLIERYADSRDSTLAAEALCLQLEKKGLPRPIPEQLERRLLPLGENGTLSAEQQALMELARVDEAANEAAWSAVDAAMVRRVQESLSSQGLLHHADLLSLLIENDKITSDADALAEVRSAWADPAVASPQMLLARTLLQHPEYCRPQASLPADPAQEEGTPAPAEP